MKKFCVFLTVVLCLAALRLDVSYLNEFDFFPDNAVYSFYVPEKVNALENVELINNGNSTIVNCSVGNAGKLRGYFNRIDGESVSYNVSNTSYALQSILSDLKAVTLSTQSLGELNIIYAYSEYFDNCVTIDGMRINVQIAVNKLKVTVGTPLILGSY